MIRNSLFRHYLPTICGVSLTTTNKNHIFVVGTQWNSSLNWIEIQTITGGFWSQISENKQKSNGHESQKIKKNPNHDSRKLKFVIFENFTNHSSSAVWRQRKLWLPQSQIMKKKWWKRDKKCMRGSEKGSVIKHALK
jgi:hypothetical protein